MIMSGLRNSMEGGGQENRKCGGRQEDLRRFPESDGCAEDLPGDHVPAALRRPSQHHPAAGCAPRRQRQGHLPRLRVHG